MKFISISYSSYRVPHHVVLSYYRCFLIRSISKWRECTFRFGIHPSVCFLIKSLLPWSKSYRRVSTIQNIIPYLQDVSLHRSVLYKKILIIETPTGNTNFVILRLTFQWRFFHSDIFAQLLVSVTGTLITLNINALTTAITVVIGETAVANGHAISRQNMTNNDDFTISAAESSFYGT